MCISDHCVCFCTAAARPCRPCGSRMLKDFQGWASMVQTGMALASPTKKKGGQRGVEGSPPGALKGLGWETSWAAPRAPNCGPERRRMHAHRLTLLFTRHCPQCHAAVRKGAAGVVRSLGRLYCCQAHADTHGQQLDTLFHDFQRRHAAHHGENRLLPEGEAKS
jgi:hypothetical protein